MTELSLNYYGGSGGFMALWVLLLGSDYRCAFDCSDSLEDIFKKQWSIQDHKTWKSTEIWPNNELTKQSKSKQKVYFHCSPSNDTWDDDQKYTRVFLYTDFDTQIELSELKNAFVNYNRQTADVYPLRPFVGWYNDIKDPSWPDIKSFADLSKLPKRIHNEVCSTLGITETYVLDLKNKDKAMFNGEYVWKDLPNKLNDADVAVKLQDIVSTNGNALLNPLGYKSNSRVKNFIAKWLALHPKQLQEKLHNEQKNL